MRKYSEAWGSSASGRSDAEISASPSKPAPASPKKVAAIPSSSVVHASVMKGGSSPSAVRVNDHSSRPSQSCVSAQSGARGVEVPCEESEQAARRASRAGTQNETFKETSDF